jgi:hypothetical protein
VFDIGCSFPVIAKEIFPLQRDEAATTVSQAVPAEVHAVSEAGNWRLLDRFGVGD